MTEKPPSARSIFEQTLKMAPGERSAYLDRTCAEDHGLRLRVQELLAAQRDAPEFLAHPTFDGFTQDALRGLNEPSVLPSSESGTGISVGPFVLLERVGDGGMGVVYIAEQKTPVRRRVAVKLIKPGMDTEHVIARFEAERQALALMNHAHIAKIHEAGTTPEGRPYFAMEYVPGTHITDYCDREKLPVRERLKLFVDICDAVQHAHHKGIVHRDLKPSNVLVSVQDGKAVAKIIDFGVAKALHHGLAEHTLYTQRGIMIGTPTYMSPEQADGAQDIDTRTDIYSLGVILYELLVGALPYDLHDSSFEAIQRAIRERETPKPSTRLDPTGEGSRAVAAQRQVDVKSLARELRGDLDWITLKALEKDRTRRFSSASELAADISRYLAGEPVLARRPSAVYRLRKFARRNRALAAATGISVVALVAGTIAVFAVEWRERLRVERVAKELLESYLSGMSTASQRLSESNVAAARDLLAKQSPGDGEEDLRGFEWRLLWSLSRGDELETFPDGTAHDVAFSPGGRYLAYGASTRDKGRVLVRNAASLSFEIVFQQEMQPTALSFSAKDRFLAASADPGSAQRGVRVWETGGWTEVHRSDEECSPARFSPDGRYLASSGTKKITLRATDDWRLVGEKSTWGGPDWNWRHTLAFSPDSQLLVIAAPGPGVLAVPSLETLQLPDVSKAAPMSAAFSSNGQRILFGYKDGGIRIWDVAEQRVLQTLWRAHASEVTAIAFAPDGLRLATTGNDQALRMWDATTFEPLGQLRGHVNSIWSLAYSPDGKRLATGSFDETVKLWSADPRPPVERVAFGYFIELRNAAGPPTLAWNLSNTLHIHDLETLGNGKETSWDIGGLGWERWRLSATLARLAAVPQADRGAVELWDVHGREKGRVLDTGIETITHLEFSRDDRRLAVGGGSAVSLWDLESGEHLRGFTAGVELNNLRLAPDGSSLAISSVIPDNRVYIWDIASGQEGVRFEGNRNLIIALAFAPDSRFLAMGGEDKVVKILNLKTGGEQILSGNVAGIASVDFSPDGKTLASLDQVGSIKLWNVAAGRELLALRLAGSVGSGNPCRSRLRFSSDGRFLVAGERPSDGSNVVRVWKVPSLEEIDQQSPRQD